VCSTNGSTAGCAFLRSDVGTSDLAVSSWPEPAPATKQVGSRELLVDTAAGNGDLPGEPSRALGTGAL